MHSRLTGNVSACIEIPCHLSRGSNQSHGNMCHFSKQITCELGSLHEVEYCRMSCVYSNSLAMF